MGSLRGVIPTDFPSLGSPWLLSGLVALYGRSRLADRLRVTNVTISNVPGTQVPVYLAGAKMLDYYPVSIVVHGVALNITVQSYMGQLCFGLIACRRAAPDMHELGVHLRRPSKGCVRWCRRRSPRSRPSPHRNPPGAARRAISLATPTPPTAKKTRRSTAGATQQPTTGARYCQRQVQITSIELSTPVCRRTVTRCARR